MKEDTDRQVAGQTESDPSRRKFSPESSVKSCLRVCVGVCVRVFADRRFSACKSADSLLWLRCVCVCVCVWSV